MGRDSEVPAAGSHCDWRHALLTMPARNSPGLGACAVALSSSNTSPTPSSSISAQVSVEESFGEGVGEAIAPRFGRTHVIYPRLLRQSATLEKPDCLVKRILGEEGVTDCDASVEVAAPVLGRRMEERIEPRCGRHDQTSR